MTAKTWVALIVATMRLALVALAIFATLACRSASRRSVSFRNPDCPVAFSYPTAWHTAVSRGQRRTTCEVSLYATAAESAEAAGGAEPSILIQLYNEPLETGTRHGGFKRNDDGEWVQLRGGSSPSGREITTPHVRGVEGWVNIRGSGRDYRIAVLGNAEWSVVISGEGLVAESDEAFDVVVQTLDLLLTK